MYCKPCLPILFLPISCFLSHCTSPGQRLKTATTRHIWPWWTKLELFIKTLRNLTRYILVHCTVKWQLFRRVLDSTEVHILPTMNPDGWLRYEGIAQCLAHLAACSTVAGLNLDNLKGSHIGRDTRNKRFSSFIRESSFCEQNFLINKSLSTNKVHVFI